VDHLMTAPQDLLAKLDRLRAKKKNAAAAPIVPNPDCGEYLEREHQMALARVSLSCGRQPQNLKKYNNNNKNKNVEQNNNSLDVPKPQAVRRKRSSLHSNDSFHSWRERRRPTAELLQTQVRLSNATRVKGKFLYQLCFKSTDTLFFTLSYRDLQALYKKAKRRDSHFPVLSEYLDCTTRIARRMNEMSRGLVGSDPDLSESIHHWLARICIADKVGVLAHLCFQWLANRPESCNCATTRQSKKGYEYKLVFNFEDKRDLQVSTWVSFAQLEQLAKQGRDQQSDRDQYLAPFPKIDSSYDHAQRPVINFDATGQLMGAEFDMTKSASQWLEKIAQQKKLDALYRLILGAVL